MIVVNGQDAPQIADGVSVAQLVRLVAGVDPDGRGIAVAVDAVVIPRGEWASTHVAGGSRVEVVGAVQGG